MSIVHKSLRETPCLADQPVHVNSAAPVHVPLLCWELHQGTVQLFIVGPGPDAWLACSQPCYRPDEPIGTERERAIGHSVVRLLNRTRLGDREAGVEVIREFIDAVTITYDRMHPAEAMPEALAS